MVIIGAMFDMVNLRYICKQQTANKCWFDTNEEVLL